MKKNMLGFLYPLIPTWIPFIPFLTKDSFHTSLHYPPIFLVHEEKNILFDQKKIIFD